MATAAIAGGCAEPATGGDGLEPATDATTSSDDPDGVGASSDATATDGSDDTGRASDDTEGDAETSTGVDEDTSTDASTGEAPIDACVGDPDLTNAVVCDPSARPGAFDPVVEWSFVGEGELHGSATTPLVANLTDDNGDGVIDLCDTPDIVLTLRDNGVSPTGGQLVALDGATGAVHWVAEGGPYNWSITPALGDIDSDGEVEIVAWSRNPQTGTGHAVALEADGSIAWESNAEGVDPAWTAVSLADLDNDGDVEIVTANVILDHLGALVGVLGAGTQFNINYSALADLDGDDDLEIITNRRAYHHDGSELYPDVLPAGGAGAGYVQVVDFDGDGQPEVLTATSGVVVLQDATGAVLATTALGSYLTHNPPAVADFDGDGTPEFALADRPDFGFFEAQGDSVAAFDVWSEWEAPQFIALDVGTTAFDFHGTGAAQAVFRDNDHWRIASPDQALDFGFGRTQLKSQNVPVVADVDNDGSAEILIVSDITFDDAPEYTLQVIGDVGQTWVGARRIFNQHSYHVTNIREDGTVPAVEPKPWLLHNTWGAQASVTALGELCGTDR